MGELLNILCHTKPMTHRINKDFRPSCRHGFTLVELAIVLVILGLLTGGILGGKSLIHAAKLRNISKEFQNYQMAVNVFEDEYLALPGDMPNATQYWGRADNGTFSGQCANPESDTGTGTETCNGDGDNWIGRTNDGTDYIERYRFWQHLANAGLIEGNYTGVTGAGGTGDSILGENVPASKFENAGWTPWAAPSWNDLSVSTQASHFTTINGNMLSFGAKIVNGMTGDPALSNKDAFNIDKKIDDGMPATGIVKTRNNTRLPDCASSDNEDAVYQLERSGPACSYMIKYR